MLYGTMYLLISILVLWLVIKIIKVLFLPVLMGAVGYFIYRKFFKNNNE